MWQRDLWGNLKLLKMTAKLKISKKFSWLFLESIFNIFSEKNFHSGFLKSQVKFEESQKFRFLEKTWSDQFDAWEKKNHYKENYLFIQRIFPLCKSHDCHSWGLHSLELRPWVFKVFWLQWTLVKIFFVFISLFFEKIILNPKWVFEKFFSNSIEKLKSESLEEEKNCRI